MEILQFVWNPTTDGIGPIKYYSLMWMLAFIIGFYIMQIIYKKEGLSMEKLDSLFVYTILGTMIGARLGHVIFYQFELFEQDFFSVFLPFSFKNGIEFTGFNGLASHGAAIGIITALFIYNRKKLKKSLLWILDRIIIAVAIGGAFIRLGNFFNSEIVGKKTESFFGIKFVQNDITPYEAQLKTGIENFQDAYKAIAENPEFINLLEGVPFRHPAQLYEAISLIIIFFIVAHIYWRTQILKKEGVLLGIFFILLWISRFFIEYVKDNLGGLEDQFGIFSTGQWLSIPFIFIGFYLILRKSKSNA